MGDYDGGMVKTAIVMLMIGCIGLAGFFVYIHWDAWFGNQPQYVYHHHATVFPKAVYVHCGIYNQTACPSNSTSGLI